MTTNDTAVSREDVLRKAYWKLRKHAEGYRDTKIFRETREAWDKARASVRQNGKTSAYERHVIHEFYARGIEEAARDIAEMLGVPEHEIEPLGADQ